MTADPKITLRDVLFEFSIQKSVPDADLLEEFIGRYPSFANALTDIAVDLVLIALRDDDDELIERAKSTVISVVSRAMSRFQNLFYAIEHATERTSTELRSRASPVENPFANLNRAGF